MRESLSGSPIPRIALPPTTERGELVRFLRNENLPGRFPFTGGVFPMRRDDEDPTRMFAGEGGPAKTNARFHMLAAGQPARLDIRAAGAHAIRVTLAPLAGPSVLPFSPAVADRKYPSPALSIRTLTKPVSAKVGDNVVLP